MHPLRHAHLLPTRDIEEEHRCYVCSARDEIPDRAFTNWKAFQWQRHQQECRPSCREHQTCAEGLQWRASAPFQLPFLKEPPLLVGAAKYLNELAVVLYPAAMNSSGSSSTSSPVKLPVSWSTNMYGGRCTVATLHVAFLLGARNTALSWSCRLQERLLHCQPRASPGCPGCAHAICSLYQVPPSLPALHNGSTLSALRSTRPQPVCGH